MSGEIDKINRLTITVFLNCMLFAISFYWHNCCQKIFKLNLSSRKFLHYLKLHEISFAFVFFPPYFINGFEEFCGKYFGALCFALFARQCAKSCPCIRKNVWHLKCGVSIFIFIYIIYYYNILTDCLLIILFISNSLKFKLINFWDNKIK